MLKATQLRCIYGSAILGCLSALSTPVLADEAMKDLLEILRDKGSITDEEYQLLRNAADADEEKLEAVRKDAEAATEEAKEASKDMPKITFKGKFKIESADGQHYFQPIGRIFWDTVFEDRDGSPDIAGGSELRRARLGFEAQFFKNWKAKLEYDFAGSDADLKDGWIAYGNKFAGDNKYSVKLGQHHVPFGFTTISSSKYMSFIRRPLFADGPLQPARRFGAAAQFHETEYRWNVHAGAFLDEPEDGEVNVEGQGEDRRTYAIRMTGVPFAMDKQHMLHLGASYMFQDLQNDVLEIDQRIISHLDTGKFFDTGVIPGADTVNSYDLEALGIWGPFYAFGEYVLWNVDATSDTDLSAYSFEGGFFLTGESKNYDKAAFGSISPKRPFGKGGWGAWEVAARYENMDLNDGAVVGGDGDVFTVGMNWYPIKNVRFMADYATVLDFEKPGDPNDGLEPAALSFRAQVYW